MSKLTNCKTCKKEVSKSAKTCPHCGEKQSPGLLKVLIWGTFAFVLVFQIITPGSNDHKSIANQMHAKQVETVTPIRVNIGKIIDDYESNEVNGDNLYKKKWVQLTGIIDNVGKDITDSMYVTLGKGGDFEVRKVQAFFDNSKNGQLAGLRKGQQLTVVCKVSGLMMNVLGKECEIIQ